MSSQDGSPNPSPARRLAQAAQVIVISSVMFTFISYWRTAAVVLCDLASTAYYIGGIVEQSVGPAAPWFILAVMLFSYAVRSVYIESCSLFVRGGVYRVVKEAMGGFLGKLSVSALMFDYILTGPISAVSAGQYIADLVVRLYAYFNGIELAPETIENLKFYKNWAAVLLAVVVTLYFFRQNVLGIHESSDKALKIMLATTVMAVILLLWCLLTLVVQGPQNSVPLLPDFTPWPNPTTHEMDYPFGFLEGTGLADGIRGLQGSQWLGLLGFIGLAIAFGHSILAMSGEETLAQVYREVESPKLPNFKKAAFIVFVYSLVVTGGISFLAVLLIPNSVRMPEFSDNLIGGLAMNVIGPEWAQLALNAFVVVVGFLILAGAVNTAIIGSNGVLNRVSEDGVMPDWFLKPHPRFGTTYRILYLILFLQLFTIVASQGDVLMLGEAYAFGVVWSFVFKALAMLVLRFTHAEHREYKVPLNFRLGKYEIPVGLGLIFLVLLVSALMNLLTKKTATVWGLSFTAVFLTIFMISEYFHERRRKGAAHAHLEQFNQKLAGEVSVETLRLTKTYRKLVAIRSPHNLFMLEKALRETDPDTTDIVVMTAKMAPAGTTPAQDDELDVYDQELMTAVVDKAERTGKQVVPLIVPTNNPLYAVLRTARDLKVQELIMGLSNKFTADEQLDQIALYWINLHEGKQPPLTVRIMSKDRGVSLDLEGSRIPKISDRQARSVADLRAAGVGVNRVLLAHDGSSEGSDLFRAVLTLLDPDVTLDMVTVVQNGQAVNGDGVIHHDQERAKQLGRAVQVRQVHDGSGAELVRLAQEEQYDLIVLGLPKDRPADKGGPPWKNGYADYVLAHAHCLVCLVAQPLIPTEVEG